MRGWIVAVASFGLIGSAAYAWAPSPSNGASTGPSPAGQVFYDQSGFPRCIASQANPGDGLLLLWDSSIHYPRTIRIASLRDRRFATFHQQSDLRGCQNWPTYLALAMQDLAGWTSYFPALSGTREGATAYGNYAIPDSALEPLSQARRGARSYYGALKPADFLRQNPIREFSRETNRRLSAQFGIGFAAEVYKLWTESLPRNGEMKARIRLYAGQAAAGRLAVPTPRRLAGFKILVAEGYMQTPRKNRLATFYQALDGMGIAHEAMQFDPLGPLESNAAGFERQIEAELRGSSKRIILAGASKGVPELLTALANLNAREPALANRAAGVLNLAGMFEGSYLVDWASSGIQSLFVKGALQTGAQGAGLQMTNLDGFHAMSSSALTRAAGNYSRRLPNLLYFNFVGVLTGDGLTRDREIGMLQTSVSIPRLGSSSGGNDGYIEYPGTMMPRAWGLRSTEIVFDSSHAIVDGFYDGRDLTDVRQRKTVFEGVFQAIADALEVRAR